MRLDLSGFGEVLVGTHKSFSEGLGPKLGRQVGSGMTRLQRWASGEGGVEAGEAAVEVREVAIVKRRAGIEGAKPWEAEGVSRATWFRRQVRKDREEA